MEQKKTVRDNGLKRGRGGAHATIRLSWEGGESLIRVLRHSRMTSPMTRFTRGGSRREVSQGKPKDILKRVIPSKLPTEDSHF